MADTAGQRCALVHCHGRHRRCDTDSVGASGPVKMDEKGDRFYDWNHVQFVVDSSGQVTTKEYSTYVNGKLVMGAEADFDWGTPDGTPLKYTVEKEETSYMRVPFVFVFLSLYIL